MAGLHAEANTFDRTPTCPSSRCDWDPYKSIEWCTKCEDLSSIATLEDCDYEKHMKEVKLSRYVPTFDFCKLKLGKGRVCPLIRMVNETAETDSGWGRAPSSPSLRIDFAHEGIWLISNPRLYEVEKETFNYLGIDNPLVVLGHFHAGYEFKEKTLVLSMPTLTILNASQCVITLCEREYAVEMRDAIPAARLISTNYGRVLDDSDDEYEKILGWSSPGSQVNSSNVQSLVGYIAELFLRGCNPILVLQSNLGLPELHRADNETDQQTRNHRARVGEVPRGQACESCGLSDQLRSRQDEQYIVRICVRGREVRTRPLVVDRHAGGLASFERSTFCCDCRSQQSLRCPYLEIIPAGCLVPYTEGSTW